MMCVVSVVPGHRAALKYSSLLKVRVHLHRHRLSDSARAICRNNWTLCSTVVGKISVRPRHGKSLWTFMSSSAVHFRRTCSVMSAQVTCRSRLLMVLLVCAQQKGLKLCGRGGFGRAKPGSRGDERMETGERKHRPRGRRRSAIWARWTRSSRPSSPLLHPAPKGGSGAESCVCGQHAALHPRFRQPLRRRSAPPSPALDGPASRRPVCAHCHSLERQHCNTRFSCAPAAQQPLKACPEEPVGQALFSCFYSSSQCTSFLQKKE